MRRYEHLTDEKLSDSLKYLQFQPDLLHEVENEQRNRAIERTEIEKKTDIELINFIVQKDEEISSGIHSFQLKYAFEQAKERLIDIEYILFEKEADSFNKRLLLEVHDINKDISKKGKYKSIRDFIQILRFFNGLVLFLSAIGMTLIGINNPIMIIPSLVGMIVWFLILKAIGICLELLTDIERNSRINLLVNIFDKSKKKNMEE